MTWRIHEHVQCGEIDNREPGRVRGRVWVHGRSEPVLLNLQGNACADIAGCLLTFRNQVATTPLVDHNTFANKQKGTAGDLTASRRVRVPDVPIRQFVRLRKQGRPAPEHMANCLYLEWFSESNGRVVIESTEFDLTISAPAWTLSPEQERQRQKEAATGFRNFIARLSAAIEATRADPPPDREWDEFDYEKLMRESDARTDKYLELLDKYKDRPDCESLLAEEMGWDIGAESGEDCPAWLATPSVENPNDGNGEDAGFGDPFEGNESNGPSDLNGSEPDPLDLAVQPDPRTEGIDWIRTASGDFRHPLTVRAGESSSAIHKACEALDSPASEDDDLLELTDEFQITAATIGGALNGLAHGRHWWKAALIVACLKRALGHLHAAQAALEKVSAKAILPAKRLAFARTELFEIREEILRLMAEFREIGRGGA